LRQALWQLQGALDAPLEPGRESLLMVLPDWIQLNPAGNLWLDVALFEQAFTLAQGTPGQNMDMHQAQALQVAVDLYQGDLLEGWYQEWCLYERERLQQLYLTMLDKLMGYSEATGGYEAGLEYGTRILRYDRASERTHQALMRLHYLAGNRAAALHQYERCVCALEEELGVKPARRTLALYQQLRADQLDHGPLQVHSESVAQAFQKMNSMSETGGLAPDVLDLLDRLQALLAELQYRLEGGSLSEPFAP
jgi:DNA-binding SARP family transcriptional activator